MKLESVNMYEIEEIIKNEFLNFNNKKVKEETLDEYLRSLKNEELTMFAVTQVFVDEDYLNLFKIKNLNKRPKEYIINYIIQNLEKILKSYVKIIKINQIEQLKLVIKNNNKKIIFNTIPISIHFIDTLKKFSIAKIEYNEKENSLKFFMPEEFIKIFNGILNNKKILDENKYNNRIFDYASSVVKTYGIITLDKLEELFSNQMFKIEKEKLHHIIASVAILDELYIYNHEQDLLFCDLEFQDEDNAICFYKQQKMHYKKYSKNDYKKIYDGTYVEELKPYKKLINYLCREYYGIQTDLDYIKEFIVNDYINFAQISIQEADKAFRKNILTVLEATEEEVEILLNYMKNIYSEYPKWIKRGNV